MNFSVAGKKSKQMERRLMKDFQIGCVENLLTEVVQTKGPSKDIFSNLAKAISNKVTGSKANIQGSKVSKDAFGRKKADPIGSSANVKDQEAKRQSMRRQLSKNAITNFKEVNVDEIVKAHPQLEGESQGTKVAFAKWTMGKERVSDANSNLCGENQYFLFVGKRTPGS
jgi:transient receptor potential cation channel subfamily C member 4